MITSPTLSLLINFVFYAVVAITCLVLGALTLNNVPMGETPGFRKRLKHYLTTNTAETKKNSEFPELELPVIMASPRMLLTRVERAMATLGWQVAALNQEQLEVKAIVESPLLRFKDDVEVQLKPVGRSVEIHIRSKSRKGKGDLGANAKHILDLLQTMQRQIEIET